VLSSSRVQSPRVVGGGGERCRARVAGEGSSLSCSRAPSSYRDAPPYRFWRAAPRLVQRAPSLLLDNALHLDAGMTSVGWRARRGTAAGAEQAAVAAHHGRRGAARLWLATVRSTELAALASRVAGVRSPLLPAEFGGCGLAGVTGDAEGGQARRRRWAPCLSFPCVHPVSPSRAVLHPMRLGD
jgi:hypothetical protein